MANSDSITHKTAYDLDPALRAIAAEQAAAQVPVAALAALDQTGAEAAWLDYQTHDLEHAVAAAGSALSEAQWLVVTTRPVSIQGAAALLGLAPSPIIIRTNCPAACASASTSPAR